VLHQHPPLSVAARKRDVQNRRAAAAAAAARPRISATLQALRECAAQLTIRGLSPFTGEDLVAETVRQHPQLRRPTLRNALAGELQRPDAHIVEAPAPRVNRSETTGPRPPGPTPMPTLLRRRLVVAAPDREEAVRPGADGRLCAEVVLDAVHHLTSPATAPHPAAVRDGVSALELMTHLTGQGHFYEPSGVYRAVRRAREAGLVTITGQRPLRVRAVDRNHCSRPGVDHGDGHDHDATAPPVNR